MLIWLICGLVSVTDRLLCGVEGISDSSLWVCDLRSCSYWMLVACKTRSVYSLWHAPRVWQVSTFTLYFVYFITERNLITFHSFTKKPLWTYLHKTCQWSSLHWVHKQHLSAHGSGMTYRAMMWRLLSCLQFPSSLKLICF